jgi:hypothetical protein
MHLVSFSSTWLRQLFHMKDKKADCFLKNKIQHAFLYKNCAGSAVCKSHLALLIVLFVIRKL